MDKPIWESNQPYYPYGVSWLGRSLAEANFSIGLFEATYGLGPQVIRLVGSTQAALHEGLSYTQGRCQFPTIQGNNLGWLAIPMWTYH